jgi:hypothetical protein
LEIRDISQSAVSSRAVIVIVYSRYLFLTKETALQALLHCINNASSDLTKARVTITDMFPFIGIRHCTQFTAFSAVDMHEWDA